MEYAWFNNVETKPGIGYPKNWEDQEEWQGGWVRSITGKLTPRLGGRVGVLSKIFANPSLPGIDDYYEPFTFDYQDLHRAPESDHLPTARPRSLISGKRMDKIVGGPNWEELLGGEFEKRARDQNFQKIQKEMYGQFENTGRSLCACWRKPGRCWHELWTTADRLATRTASLPRAFRPGGRNHGADPPLAGRCRDRRAAVRYPYRRDCRDWSRQ
jgi:hypothetical protein